LPLIAVSDVHLGYLEGKDSISDTKNFISFLGKLAERTDITDFVICGDLLDMWRRDLVGVTLENLHILKMIQDLQPKINVHLTDHYYPFHLTKCDPKKCLRLTEGNKAYYFKHGYDFEYIMKISEEFFDLLCDTSDDSGEFLSALWDRLDLKAKKQIIDLLKEVENKQEDMQNPLVDLLEIIDLLKEENKQKDKKQNPLVDLLEILEKKPGERLHLQGNRFNVPDIGSNKKNYLGRTYTPVLVYGHTHKPFHHQNEINLGSWLKTEEKHNTYLEVINDKERLMVWNKDDWDKNEEITKEVA
jgi:UDP-2,3-diacylglucosamine pyrophosphatase LpxH